ncbi:MAG TPA: GNAT family N-acetyltransferase [Opitutus sp.]|nr:GNAT family N-acetyltransferase [Opitutus sp.]
MPRPPEHFETARLWARPPRAEDAPAVFAAYAGDPEVTRFLAWPTYASVDPLADYLRGRTAVWQADTPQSGDFMWLLGRRGTDAPIGSIGATVEGAKVMFGYVLGRAHWGRGYATEALRFLVGWALAEPAVRRAWACCAVENAASIRVMEKAGLEREGLLRRWHAFPNLGPGLQDCVLYARVK